MDSEERKPVPDSLETYVRGRVELHCERLERRRRWAVVLGLASLFLAFLLAAGLVGFDSDLLPGGWEYRAFVAGSAASVSRAPTDIGEAFLLIWTVVAAIAVAGAITAIKSGIGSLSKLRRETRGLAFAGIGLGLVTIGIIGVLGLMLWQMIDTAYNPRSWSVLYSLAMR